MFGVDEPKFKIDVDEAITPSGSLMVANAPVIQLLLPEHVTKSKVFPFDGVKAKLVRLSVPSSVAVPVTAI